MRKIMCLVLTVICLLALAGCGGGTKNAEAPVQKQAAEKVLRVGTDADYPPFGYYQEVNKTFLGFDVELIQGVARKMGYTKVEFVDLEFNNLLPSLQDGQVDAVISCMTITDERRKMVDFTEPYLISSNVVIGSVDTKATSLDALKDKRIAAEVGSVHANQAKQYSRNVITCSSAEEALKLVMDKKADFAIVDNHTAGFFITNFYNGKLNKDKGIGIAVAKGNKELADQLNEGLREYMQTASYLQMKKTYFGKPNA